MSVGARRIPHAFWCPALSNRPPRPKRISKGVVVEWHPVGERFDCLCGGGSIRLTDPRPEVVEGAVARYQTGEVPNA